MYPPAGQHSSGFHLCLLLLFYGSVFLWLKFLFLFTLPLLFHSLSIRCYFPLFFSRPLRFLTEIVPQNLTREIPIQFWLKNRNLFLSSLWIQSFESSVLQTPTFTASPSHFLTLQLHTISSHGLINHTNWLAILKLILRWLISARAWTPLTSFLFLRGSPDVAVSHGGGWVVE